jgi:hypothetical protein
MARCVDCRCTGGPWARPPSTSRPPTGPPPAGSPANGSLSAVPAPTRCRGQAGSPRLEPRSRVLRPWRISRPGPDGGAGTGRLRHQALGDPAERQGTGRSAASSPAPWLARRWPRTLPGPLAGLRPAPRLGGRRGHCPRRPQAVTLVGVRCAHAHREPGCGAGPVGVRPSHGRQDRRPRHRQERGAGLGPRDRRGRGLPGAERGVHQRPGATGGVAQGARAAGGDPGAPGCACGRRYHLDDETAGLAPATPDAGR